MAEGAAKPESTPVWTEATAVVRKLAHYTRVNDEVIADFDTFQQVIGSEMLSGLIDREMRAGHRDWYRAEHPRPCCTPGRADSGLGRHRPRRHRGSVRCAPRRGLGTPTPTWSSCTRRTAGTRPGLGARQGERRRVPARRPGLGGQAVAVGCPSGPVRVDDGEHGTGGEPQAGSHRLRPAAAHGGGRPVRGGTTEFIANQTLIRAETRLALAIHHPTAICLVTAI